MEKNRVYPGDDLLTAAVIASTYAEDIQAEPAEIWPWIVQVGYHRGGWYIDAWWDRLIQNYFWPLIVPKEDRGEFQPAAEEILRDLQNLQMGDIVPDGPPGTAYYEVAEMVLDHYMILRSSSHFKYMLPKFTAGTRFEPHGMFTWAFILERRAPGITRLTIRFRGWGEPRLVVAFMKPVLLVVDYFHVREMLKGFKRRVESGGRLDM